MSRKVIQMRWASLGGRQRLVRRPPRPCRRAAGVAGLSVAVWALAGLLGSPPAALADSCPNAQFRTGPAAGLPDCRAYELVSPGVANGATVSPPLSASSAVSSDGQHVLYRTAVVFPGSSSSPVFSDYLSTRTPMGWSTTDLAAPGSGVSSGIAGIVDASVDFSRLVFTMPFSLDSNDRDGDPFAGNNCSFAEGGSCDDIYIRNPDGSWTWVSQNDQPKTSPVVISYSGESADQSHVLFEAQAPLTSNDSGQRAGYALYDRTGGHTVLVGVNTDRSLTSACGSVIAAPPTIGFALNSPGQSLQPSNAVSSDGSRVFFESPDPAASGDPSCSRQKGGTQPVELYLRQGNATTTEISLSQKTGSVGTPAPDGATFQAASSDGSKVLFTSPDQLTNDAAGVPPYLYEYDVNVSGDPLTFLGTNAFDAASGSQTSVLGFSRDLSYVYFLSGGVLSVWHNRMVTAVPGNHSAHDAEVTPDGSRLVFNDFVAGHLEVYLYDAPTNMVSCLSCAPGGAPSAGDSVLSPGAYVEGFFGSRFISDDGSRVFFESPNPLVPQAVSGVMNVYEWENGKVSLISNAASPYGSQLIGASASGNDVFFTTPDSLVPQDQTNGDTVVYDARVDGGLAGPAPAAVCGGEACQGQPSAPPPAPVAATIAFTGPGNLPRVPTPKVRVLSRIVHGASFFVRVNVGGKGRIKITGPGIRTVMRSVGKPGTYRLRVTLTSRSEQLLEHKRKLKLNIHVVYAPQSGQGLSARLAMTVKAR